MMRTLVAGLLLAIGAVGLVIVGSWLSLGLASTLFAASCGAVLALVPTHSPLARVGGFLIGFVISWVVYGVRAEFLPQTTYAAAYQAAIAVVLMTLVAVVARGRIPFWSLLLGAATMAGAYDFTFAAAPYNFIASSIATAAATLLSVSIGILAVFLVDLLPMDSSGKSSTQDEPQTDPARRDYDLAILDQGTVQS